MNEFFGSDKMKKGISFLLVILTLFLIAKTAHEFMSLRNVGGNANPGTITVTGSGDTFAVPDVATISFSINESGSTMEEAQNKASIKNNQALEYLKSQGIEDKDVRTEGYNANPQYDYNAVVCVKYSCPPSTPKIVGYEVAINISVKVHKVENASKIISGLGTKGISNITGPSLGIDDEDSLKADARVKAIDDAKVKAAKLASDLGVRLGKIVSYSESSGGYPSPMYAMEAKSAVGGGPVTADIARGQNKVTLTIQLTYEIK